MPLKKILSLLLFLNSFAFAIYNNQLIENIYIQNNEIKKELLYFKGEKLDTYKVQVVLNNNLPKNQILYLEIFCDINNLIESNVNYIKEKKSIIVKIDTNKLEDFKFFFLFFRKKANQLFYYKYE